MLALLIVLSLIAAVGLAAARAVVFPLVSGARLPEPKVADRDLELRLERHIRTIASTPHHLGCAADLEAAARYIEAELAASGHKSQAQVFDVQGTPVRNIEVVFEPACARAASPQSRGTLVIGAHYDSAEGTPGANDNGTGVAALLEIARAFAQNPLAPKRRLRLVFFVNEELPYGKTEHMGALRHARQLKASGEPVAGMIALETIGYFSNTPGSQRLPFPFNKIYPDTGHFLAFVGLPGSRGFLGEAVAAFRAASDFPSTGTVVPAFVEGADLSDHWAYHHVGFPALMATDTAPYRNPFYHQPYDLPDTVNYGALAHITRGLETMVRKLAETG
jgi:Peptidase family M28